MLAPDAAFIAAIKTGNVKIAEIYQMELSSGFTHYFTSHDQDILWDDPSTLYLSVPIMRNDISTNINLEVDVAEISLANISGELYGYAQLNVLDAVKVTIKRIIWSDSGSYSAGAETTMFIGVADVEFTRAMVTLKCRSILDSLNIVVPRGIYQEPCCHSLFGTGCGLTQSSYGYAGTTSDASPNRFTIIDTATTAIVYTVDFDEGDSDLPIEIGDTLVGGIAGSGTCVGINYETEFIGSIYYVIIGGAQFVDDEEITVGVNSIQVNGTPDESTSYYQLGEVTFTDGPNEGFRRMIRSSTAGTYIITNEFPFAISAGDGYIIYPGCDKTGITCRNIFDNVLNFGGFLFIPQIQETIM